MAFLAQKVIYTTNIWLSLRPLREQRLWNGRDSVIVEKHFLLIIVREFGQTYQQNRRKLRAEAFLSAAIFCKNFDMVSKLMRYKNVRVVFNFPSSLHKVVSSNKYRVQSILCIKTCEVFVSWVVKKSSLR